MEDAAQRSALSAFYSELVSFVEREFSRQRKNFDQTRSQPEDTRVNKGRCVPGLRFERRTADGDFRFVCADNPSDFREGDLVCIHRGDPHLPDTDLVWVGDGILGVDRDFVDLRVPRNQTPPRIDRDTDYTLDASFLDLEKTVRRALDEMAGTDRGRERILPLFMEGGARDEVDPAEYDAGMDAAEEAGFNDTQQVAIAEGVSARWCCLIQGPPGTGKTRVLANIVKQRAERGERILVSAFTHRAIHEALNAVVETMPEFDRIAKIGQPIIDPRLKPPQYESFTDSPFKDEEGAYILGATPFAARGSRLAGVEFDCVVIDEASQMTLPLAVMAMLSADVYVIIGDPKQLPPVIQSVPNWEAPGLSVFNRLEKNNDRVMLEVTYRMNQEITNWASEQFYLGRLTASETCAGRRLALEGLGKVKPWLREVLSPEQSFVWLETAAQTTRHYSMEEAALVMQIVAALIQSGHPAHEIGIVTPFRRQARTIRRRLRQSLDVEDVDSNRIVIDTVERMQGQERELIIISTAASDPGFIAHLQEFLYLPSRLNVAVTRARTKVIIMASGNFLHPPNADTDVREAADLWQSFKHASYFLKT